MKGSSISRFNPWSKLHPPLPRTPRQSQQLLDALTSSFRRQLDREHPTTARSLESSSANNTSKRERSTEEHPHSSVHATDKHLRTILENPLFRVIPPRSVGSSESDPDIDPERLKKEPMVVFDELVASGYATREVIEVCLRSQLLLASPYTGGEAFVKALRNSRAGSRVASWWFSSDAGRRTTLLQDYFTLNILFKFMVAEGLHKTIFVWLTMLANRDMGSPNGQLKPVAWAQETFRNVLNEFLKAEMVCGGGMGSSIRYYLEACHILISTGDKEPKLPLKKSLFSSGAYICSQAMMSSRDHAHDVPAQLYEQYMTMISTVGPMSFLEASVPLYHPTHPNATPFLNFVRNIQPEMVESWQEARRERFMQNGFDALRILVETRKLRDCSFLARFMQRLLEGKREAEKGTNNGYHVSSEEMNLLNSLDLAFR